MEKQRMLHIGYGNMGSAFLIPLQKSKLFEITVLSPNSKPNFECFYYSTEKDLQVNQNGKAPFDYIIFAVKPYQIENILEELPPLLYNDSTKMISLIAGVKCEIFQAKLQGKPGIIRVMANLPVKDNQGVLAVYPSVKLEFLEILGQVIYCEEEVGIDKFTSIIGSGSGFCFHIFKAYEEATKKLDLPEGIDSKKLILNLFKGSLTMAERSDDGFEELKSQVVTPNGTTHAGLEKLKSADTYFGEALEAAFERCKTISKK